MGDRRGNKGNGKNRATRRSEIQLTVLPEEQGKERARKEIIQVW